MHAGGNVKETPQKARKHTFDQSESATWTSHGLKGPFAALNRRNSLQYRANQRQGPQDSHLEKAQARRGHPQVGRPGQVGRPSRAPSPPGPPRVGSSATPDDGLRCLPWRLRSLADLLRL